MKYHRPFFIIFVLFVATIDRGIAEQTEYTFSRAPQLSSRTLLETWNPLVQRVSRELGVKIRLKLYSSRKEFLQDVYKGVPDFVYMNPYYTLKANKTQGYQPLIRDGKKKLAGILVVRKDSEINSLRELNGKVIGFPSPNALGASLYMRALLEREHHISFTPRYLQSHDNVYLSTALNQVAAGGGVMRTFNTANENIKTNLRILFQTPEINPHPISAHPRVPRDIRQKFVRAVLNMTKDAAGKKILNKIHIPDPLEANLRRDYSALEKLDLDSFSGKQ